MVALPIDNTAPALLMAVRAGDHDAFAVWMARTRPTVTQVCRASFRSGSPDDIADLVATVYLHAWRARQTLRPDRSGVNWLCRIAQHVAIDEWRRRRRCPEEPATEAMLLTLVATDEALARALAADQVRAITAVLRQLPPHQVALLLLRDRDALPIAEIAARTGLRRGAVRSALFRARRAFRLEWARQRAGTHPGRSA